jgi:tRNA nucleotidyltransferase/poly(A) polymerase
LDAVSKDYPLIRWTALMHDLGKVPARGWNGEDYTFHNHEFYSAEIANNIMKRMKFSNNDRDYVVNLINHHMFKCSNEMRDSAIRRFVASLGIDYVDDLYILKYADRVGKGVKTGEIDLDNTTFKIRLKKILEEDKILKIKDLAINGNDVMRILNISPSKKVGECLRKLYELVIEKPELNKKEELEKLMED